MNTANLQLEGLLLAIAHMNNALVQKGIFSKSELDALFARAETAAGTDHAGALSQCNTEAVIFPIRVLRFANNNASEDGVIPISELAPLVSTLDNPAPRSDPAERVPTQPHDGGNPNFFNDAVPPPARPDVTQGAIIRGATEDRRREAFQADPGMSVDADLAHPVSGSNSEGDNQESVAVTPAEAIAAFGKKS